MLKGNGNYGYRKLKQDGLATRARGKMNWGTGDGDYGSGDGDYGSGDRDGKTGQLGVGNYDVASSG